CAEARHAAPRSGPGTRARARAGAVGGGGGRAGPRPRGVRLRRRLPGHRSGVSVPSRFKPLPEIVTYDDFDRGARGWLDLTPNFTEPGFQTRTTILDKAGWGAPMLSTATFFYVGTHGSMDGTYSLKLATKPVAAPYTSPPKPGSMSHAIKRLSRYRDWKQIQFEMFYA